MMGPGLLKWRGFLRGFSRRFPGRFFLAAAVMLLCQPAFAEKRVALVLGNSAYQNVPPLSNPINDGGLMAATFKQAGFDVVESRYDLTALETRRVLRDFADRARDADIAVVYYAGHGMEVDGTNYLIPVDARLERDTDVYDEAFSLDRILVAVEPAKQLRLVILDACRDNPFARNMKHSMASRSIGRGLARVEPTSTNTLIAYSAKAGSTAQDGDGKNSPFTTALSQHLTTPGLDVRKAFGFVRDDVLRSTGNRQEPFVYGSLGGNDVPLVPARAAPAQPLATPQAATPQAGNPQADIRRDYELALQVGNKAAMSVFLAQHPDGFYASLAKLQLDKISAEETHAAAAEKARLAEQERARLAAEGAKKDAQAKADADARAAEAARLAAEKAKQAAQAQAAEAERQRGERITSNPVVASNAATETSAPAAPADKGTELAALSTGPSQPDLTKSVQSELRRVGCLKADADGDWNTASQRSLTQFNRYAKTSLNTKTASNDALDTIKQKPSRVCPLTCEHGYKADGDHCTRIVCAEGSFVNDDNECEKRRGKNPVAKRDEQDRRDRRDRADRFDRPERAPRGPTGYDIGIGGYAPPPARPRAASGGGGQRQIVCDSVGCRPVAPGCHLEYKTTAQGGPREGGGGNVQVCN
jgi:uncharacterized caspase-like protein